MGTYKCNNYSSCYIIYIDQKYNDWLWFYVLNNIPSRQRHSVKISTEEYSWLVPCGSHCMMSVAVGLTNDLMACKLLYNLDLFNDGCQPSQSQSAFVLSRYNRRAKFHQNPLCCFEILSLRNHMTSFHYIREGKRLYSVVP